jgi:hypothetical protein
VKVSVSLTITVLPSGEYSTSNSPNSDLIDVFRGRFYALPKGNSIGGEGQCLAATLFLVPGCAPAGTRKSPNPKSDRKTISEGTFLMT